MRFLPPLLLGTMLSTQALALDHCNPSEDDRQTRTCSYNPSQRYVVSGLVGYPIDLKFGETERIKRIEFAYTGSDKDGNPAQTWRGPAVKGSSGSTSEALPADRFQNNLPIWPFQGGHSALVVVTAMADGSERTYLFDLIARKADECTDATPGDESTNPCNDTTSALTFTYPADVKAAAAKASEDKRQAAMAAWQAQHAKKQEQSAIARLRTDVFYGKRSFAYQAKSELQYKFLVPKEVSDNGWLTEMQWPENVQLPSITILDPATGDERTAPVSQQDHMQIIATTAEWWRLRLGPKAVMDIHNLAWSPNRPNPETGTTSPDVQRHIIYQNAKR